MGIRCACPQGHPLNIKQELAGRRGVCPRCGATFTIPSTAASDGTDAEKLPEGSVPPLPEAVEWRAASPTGESYGPTVPPLFAQWIAQGRIQPDWQVWRTGWTDWRMVADVVSELPAPLSAAAPSDTPPPVSPQVLQQPKPEPQATPAAAALYSNRRRLAARRLQSAVIVMGVVALVLVGVLVWIVAR